MYARTTSSPTPPPARRMTSVAVGDRLADAAGWAVALAVLSDTVWSCAFAENIGTAAAINHARYFIFFIRSLLVWVRLPYPLDPFKDRVIHTDQRWFQGVVANTNLMHLFMTASCTDRFLWPSSRLHSLITAYSNGGRETTGDLLWQERPVNRRIPAMFFR